MAVAAREILPCDITSGRVAGVTIDSEQRAHPVCERDSVGRRRLVHTGRYAKTALADVCKNVGWN